MKRVFVLILILTLESFQICYTLQFKQVSNINEGQDGIAGLIKAYDTNHDGYKELLFHVPDNGKRYVPDYEYRTTNQYLLSDTIASNGSWYIWDVMDFKNDGLTDVLINGSRTDTINLITSQNHNSYPSQLLVKFKADVPNYGINRYYWTDLDRDGLQEITCYSADNDTLTVYENSTNDSFYKVYQTLVLPYVSAEAFAFGDADKDSITEFITGGGYGAVLIFKCMGNNDYQIVWMDTTRISRAAYDPVFVPDMDGNGLPQFVMGCVHNPGSNKWTAVWKFYEADTTVPNSFKVVYIDSLQNINTWPDYESSSSCGDIDGDGVPEAVLAVSNNWLVYKGNGPGQFQRIYKAYTTGNSRANTSVCVADMNGNGYAEVIEGGAINSTTSETRIWEVMGEVAWGAHSATALDSCIQVYWSTTRRFAGYGFNVYRATAAAGPYSLVHQTNDTIRLDSTLLNYTYNDSAVATGTMYYYKVRALLLNDSTKMIGPDSALGLTGKPENRTTNYEFRLVQNRPNPFKQSTIISYQIPKSQIVNLQVYNVAGQLVKTLVSGVQEAGAHSVQWYGRNEDGKRVSNGIYFCRLRAGGQELSRRMIVVR